MSMREIDDFDVPPEFGKSTQLPPPDDDVAPLICQHPDCNEPLTYSGRGRKPRFCGEHKASSSGGGTRATSKRPSKIETSLEQTFIMAAIMIGGAGVATGNQTLSTDAEIIRNAASNMAKAWADYADKNPKIRKSLEKMLNGVGAGGVVIATAPVVISIAMNHANAAKEKKAAKLAEQAPVNDEFNDGFPLVA